MEEKSTIPTASLFDRNVRWWWMYSFADVGCSAAIKVSYDQFEPGRAAPCDRLSFTRARRRVICARFTSYRRPFSQHDPEHEESCDVRAEHCQRHNFHRLQHHHEQRDHHGDLGCLADEERAYRS